MSKICIITSYTDHIRWDNYGKCDYGDFASLNHHEYSNKHGYSYIKEIVRNDEYSNWHPTWIKIYVLKKYLPLYDYVVWIDADVITAKKLPLSVLTDLLLPEYLSMYMGVTYDTSKDGTPGNWLCPETGIFAVNTQHEKFNHFRDEYCRRYRERDYQDLRRFYDNDVLGAALNVVQPVEVNDLCAGFQKGYKTPLRHTVLGQYLIHHKAKHSKAAYSKSDVDDVCFDPDRDQSEHL
jgi:hypothetical protein